MADDVPDLTPEELEMIAEEVLQKPVIYGDTAKAVAAMEARLSRLSGEKGELLSRIDNATGERLQRLEADLKDLNQELFRTTDRLASYRAQHEGRN
jgi:hypothetical protein